MLAVFAGVGAAERKVSWAFRSAQWADARATLTNRSTTWNPMRW